MLTKLFAYDIKGASDMKRMNTALFFAFIISNFNTNAMEYIFGNPISTKVKECVTEILSPENIGTVLPPKSIKAILDSEELITMLVEKGEEAAKKHPLVKNGLIAHTININYEVAESKDDTTRIKEMEERLRKLLGKQVGKTYDELVKLSVKEISNDDQEKLMSLLIGVPSICKKRKSICGLLYKISDSRIDALMLDNKNESKGLD